jgi:hypothetical protein
MNFKIPDTIIEWVMRKLFNYNSRNSQEMYPASSYTSFVEECI